MAKSKNKAYDVADILGVKPPGEKKPATTKAKKPTKKQPQAKQAKAEKSKPASRPADDKPTPYKEKRDARLQAVIPKRLLFALRDEADRAGVSVNEVVNTLLENGLKERG